ncbi:MAG: class I mannose-6-phosphate isomerase [Candidatus Acidiferrales bacterium]
MPRLSNYDKFPVVPVARTSAGVQVGWHAIGQLLRGRLHGETTVVCVECYPGAFVEQIAEMLKQSLQPAVVIRSADSFKSPARLQHLFESFLTDDPVFGRMNQIEIADFFDPGLLHKTQRRIAKARGVVLVIGTGASLLAPPHRILVYADMARWEIQQRQRRDEIGNLGADNRNQRPSLKYKRAFFIDWRAADRLKKQLLGKFDFYLDTNNRAVPKMITGEMFLAALQTTARRPFRVVPFFDPGPWGGQWMKEVCDLPRHTPNYAWCFDCVPEENSLLFGFGDVRIESPAINLVFRHPRELLGDAVHGRFGAEFPIRFDFLDTWEGGNLSLQVHPLTEYIQAKFGMHYTQDESYYLLDAKKDGAVYLGLKNHVDRDKMARDLFAAQRGGPPFDAARYVNKFPAKKHDHFLIPAGTIHCSGKNSLVLEISATPYIFTFKLWDWGRMGLDGTPRPIHIEHGINNIQWDLTTNWVRQNLLNHFQKLRKGRGWREERTGLHVREFIETRRHWFRARVPHRTAGSVNVLNLVEGEEAIVESPRAAFAPLIIHYAETFIVPAALGEYTIRPHGPSRGKECATIKAFVRKEACNP